MKNWHYIEDSVKGLSRDVNKDRTFIINQHTYMLAVIFDGVSSAKQANQGIDLAINFIKENHTKLSSDTSYTLQDLALEMNEVLFKSNLESPYSTFSAAYILKNTDRVFFANIGDSRIYEITPQYAKQLSEDQNLAGNQNVVTAYLGMENLTKKDIQYFSRISKNKFTKFLLCSDGFYLLLERKLKQIHEVLNFKKAGNARQKLRSKLSGDNTDDASYILIFK